MNVDLISPERSLIDEVAGRLSPTGLDYSSSMVVFPGKRPSHFLRRALAKRHGSSIVPPRIFSIDGFIDHAFTEVLDRTGRKLDTVDAIKLLFDVHRGSGKPLGGAGFLTADSFFPLGLKLYRDIEELLLEGVSPALLREVETLAEARVPPQAAERLQSLSYFYERFYGLLVEMNLTTRSLRYRAVLEASAEGNVVGAADQAIFAGFVGLTRTERELFRRLLERDQVTFLFQAGPGVEKTLAELAIARELPKGGTASPEVRFYKSPDTHGQAFGLAEILKTRAEEGGLNERSVIVLPSSETLFPVLHQALGILPEESYNVSMGYPLVRTPVYGFFNSLMRLVLSMDEGRVYVPDYLAFVLHPYTKNITLKGRSDLTRMLLHSVEEVLTRSKGKTFLSLEEIEGNGEVLRMASERATAAGSVVPEEELGDHLRRIHQALIGRFSGFEDVGDFARRAIAVLTFIDEESTARMHPYFQPFAEAIMEHLFSIANSLMKDVAFAEPSGYFRFFKKYIATCHAPFEGTPLRGLQVLGFLETRGLRFDTVYVLDANEDVIPEANREDSLLPLLARQALGLPTYSDRDRLSQYYFDNLIRGAREVHLFYVENDRREKSRFVERLLWEKQLKDGEADPAAYVKTVSYQLNLENYVPAPIPKTEAVATLLRQHTFSASALDTYLICPLKFYYRYVLGLGAREELSGDVEREEVGLFVHRVLHEFLKDRKGRPLAVREGEAAAMAEIVEMLFREVYQADPRGAAYLLKKQVLSHMRDFVNNYHIPLIEREPVTILCLEEPIRATVDGFALKGRPDRIERRRDRIVIIDYKTGAAVARLKTRFDRLDPMVRSTWNAAIGSLQLPFYLLLYAEGTGEAVAHVAPMYLLLGRSHLGAEIEVPLFGEGDSAEGLFETLKGVILRLLGEIVEKNVPFYPPPDPRAACPGCEYTGICGTQWITR